MKTFDIEKALLKLNDLKTDYSLTNTLFLESGKKWMLHSYYESVFENDVCLDDYYPEVEYLKVFYGSTIQDVFEKAFDYYDIEF